MPSLTSLRSLPRYRDPISRNVARLLLRSLQEQHRATTDTVVEFEARFGYMQGQAGAHRFEFPVSTVTAAILDPLHKKLFSFAAGVSRPIFKGVELGLREKGSASAAEFNSFPPHYRHGQVILYRGNHRLSCTLDLMDELQGKKNVARGGGASAHLPGGLENPHRLVYGIVPCQAVQKSAVALLDMCCPDWCADIRFAVSTEKSLPLQASDILRERYEGARYRARLSFRVSPFFAVHVSESVAYHHLWWFPVQHIMPPTATPAADGQDASSLIIPCPKLFKPMKRGTDHATPSSSVVDSGLAGQEVEVEVDVPALLRAWKKVYGGAAASAYLDTAALSSTTLAGTVMDSVMATATLAGQLNRNDFTAAEVHASALAEREDPFLLRVAEDYMALLQFLAQIRVVE